MGNKLIDKMNEEKEQIAFAEECGLDYTGNYEDGRPQFCGNNKAWATYNDGGY